MLREKVILHPFLCAAFPVIMIYLINIGETPLSDIFYPLFVSIGLSIIFYFILNLILSNKYKTGLILTAFIILFFSFGHVNALINYYITKFEIQLVIWAVIFILLTFFILKSRNSFIKSTGILNTFGLILILSVLLQIGFYNIKKASAISMHQTESEKFNTKTSIKLNDSKHPDVYYIILDGYARNDILKSVYNFDNWEFTKFLTDKGFYIAEQSRANYVLTPLSVASSLNMNYLNDTINKFSRNSSDMQPMIDMIHDNFVMHEFKKLGYKNIFLKSYWGNSKKNSADEIIDDKKFSQFSIMVVYTTILAPYMDKIGIINNQRNSILTSFSRLSEIPDDKNATFTFAHLLIPHPPYIFGKNGEKILNTEMKFHGNAWKNREAYINQLIFTNDKMKSLINTILKKSSYKPIIIIQADHGTATGLENTSWETADTDVINERTGIFNAYFLPENVKNKLYQTISPVNSFKLILNELTGNHFKLLKEETFFSSYENPYKLKKNSFINK